VSDSPTHEPSNAPETLLTGELLQRAKDGDRSALEQVLQRYLPRLQRWASGRLPMHARSLLDTSDLVQETLIRTMEALDRIDVRAPGMFQAYVRRAVLNRIRDQVRYAGRRPGPGEVPPDLPDASPSPLELAIGADVLGQFERAMESLAEEDRVVLHLRIELDYDYDEIAVMTGRATRDAARMAVQRALTRLAREMGRDA